MLDCGSFVCQHPGHYQVNRVRDRVLGCATTGNATVRFPPEIISHAVCLYHRFGMSVRDVGDLSAERGVIVSYEAIRLWCGKLTQTPKTVPG